MSRTMMMTMMMIMKMRSKARQASPSSSSSSSSSSTVRRSLFLLAVLALPAAATAQEDRDPNAIPFEGPGSWQQAAVAALNRHLPVDSGYFVLGPLDLGATLPDTADLVRTTLRIIAPDPRASRNITRHLWVPTGGVALDELQPSDTLFHPMPPGYSGRLLKGSIAGETALVQVFTIQEHRWLIWAQRAQIDDITEEVAGPIARYANAVTRYLAAVDSGRTTTGPPAAAEYGLEPVFDLYAQAPQPVVRDRQGYERLLAENRSFSFGDDVRDVDAFVPGPPLVSRMREGADPVLYPDKDGDIALQHLYRDFQGSGGRWSGYPLLNATTIGRLQPGRYLYITDRFGVIRVALAPSTFAGSSGRVSAALLAHGDPLRAAGELVIESRPGEPARVVEVNIDSEQYFFSNLSLTLYEDVEMRSNRYVAAVGHVLTGLDQGRLPTENILVRKY